MPASKHAISAVSADGRVYVFGGGLSVGVSVTPETVILVLKNQVVASPGPRRLRVNRVRRIAAMLGFTTPIAIAT